METLTLSFPLPNVAQVTLNRPKKLNAMNIKMYEEILSTFTQLEANPDVRVIVLTGNEKSFCAGMDLFDFQKLDSESSDPGRKALAFQRVVKKLQDPINSVADCGKPVIAAVSGYCIGAGVDLLSACDIRYCSNNTTVSVREVVIGMAADIGSLQRLPKIVGNNSWIRELVYTGKNVTGKEATEFGLFSKIFNSYDEVLRAALDVAKEISEKSPVAVVGCKKILEYSRDHSVQDGLEFVRNWNSFATQSSDFYNAIMGQIQKKKPEFPKL